MPLKSRKKEYYQKIGYPLHFESTQFLGDYFLDGDMFLLFKVPLVIVPQKHDFILNLNHSIFSSVEITCNETFTFENPLFKMYFSVFVNGKK